MHALMVRVSATQLFPAEKEAARAGHYCRIGKKGTRSFRQEPSTARVRLIQHLPDTADEKAVLDAV